MKSTSRNLLAGLMVGFLTVPLVAHHSFATEFDATKPVTKTGFVTKIDWTNPHVWFYLSVKDKESGKSAIWGFEDRKSTRLNSSYRT